MKAKLAEIISKGLKRKSISTCSKWACSYRVMGNPFPGKWNFDNHPWLLEMHDAEESKLIGQKAAQMGFTEWAINTAFFCMDVRGLDVLYILPTTDDASDFSAGRFDPALELSEHLRDFFADVNNVGLKRAGSNILYVRGSHSRSKLKSIPTPVLIFDEVDEMPKATFALAEERQSGQVIRKTLALSTPTIEDFGINGEYKLTTQEHFYFRCPSCSRLTELVYPDCLVITGDNLLDPNLKNSHYICKECKNVLPHETKNEWLKEERLGGKARWIPSYTDRDSRGFTVSQMYSMVPAGEAKNIAIAALKARNDPTRAQELYNSKLGVCFEAEGARVSYKQISDCIRDYFKGATYTGKIVTFGMDVGSVLHIVVKEYSFENWAPGLLINDLADAKLLLEIETSGGINDFNEARQIFGDYRCVSGVVDAEPERRESLRFAQTFFGRVFVCDYQYSQSGREVSISEEELTLKVNRTAWLDVSLGRYKNGTIVLPKDVSDSFRNHIHEPVRIYKEDKWGNKYGVYESVKPDHFAHADTYSEIALPLGASFAMNMTITDLY